jgi:hypothetical protein
LSPCGGEKFLIEGTDSAGTHGSTVVHSPAWAAVLRVRKHIAATSEFDLKVQEFFEPLLTAAKVIEQEDLDDFAMTHVVIDEPIEGQEGQVVHLDAAGVILKLIEDNKLDKVRWVHDELFVLA